MHARVLIADDDSLVRRVIGAALRNAGFEVCGEAADADGATHLALQVKPDLCLLDIYMPGSGIRAAQEISRALPETTVVMLTSSARDQDLVDSLQAGARGYLPKKIESERLRETLEKVLDGEVVMPRELVAKAIREGEVGRRVRWLPDGRRVELTARQLELLDMLAHGRTSDEIAERWSVGGSDVEQELAATLALLDVPDAEAAVRIVAS
jgi:DNA-binding NarL/FixJ family response regulator